MSRQPPPTSPKRSPSDREWQKMNDIRSALPAPTFLGRPEYGYSTYGSQLPSLTLLNETRMMADRPGHDERHPAQAHTPGATPHDETGTPRTAGGAIPIAALLTESPSNKDHRAARTDSIIPPNTYRAQASYPGPERPVVTHSYPSASASPSPVIQYGSSFSHNPPAGYHYAEPPRGQPMVHPTFPSPYGPPQLAQPFHRRQQSSIHSPASGSSESPRPYPEEPRSAASEVPPHHFSFPAPQEPSAPELEYKLVMRQQPKAARACGFGERDRRVVDPPPIVEVKARNAETGDSILVRDSYTTLHCMLINAQTGQDASQMSISRGEVNSAQRLMGCAVTSPWVGNDETGTAGSFFVFADLSVRSSGKYKLLFRLLKVDPSDISRKNKNFILAAIESDPFEVFTAKEFPGMRASSALLRALRAQGLNVGVKKGSESSRRKDAHGSDDGEGDEDEEESRSSEEDSSGESEEEGGSTKKSKSHKEDGQAGGSRAAKGKGPAKRARRN
ncbi:hypothetical protein K461DRAFT_289103 [Myriangium duriaei CBS 260.36]|uniref:Velvet domain-containing protein n=1 Tax=Myriangium duriaei CBS 260.36 TaxID=1168546 RepID=A0A9P4MKX6_9PEZI|nr:hypothetical protein K461DRAFT_289103 [Myriangium duriaei CBS 260.36]